MAVEELRDDCDGDALVAARPPRRACLPHRLALVLRAGALAHDLRARPGRGPRAPTRRKLLDEGVPAVARKVGEEAVEVVRRRARGVRRARRLRGGRPDLPPVRPARRPRPRPRGGRGRARSSRALRRFGALREGLRDHVDDHEQEHRHVGSRDQQDRSTPPPASRARPGLSSRRVRRASSPSGTRTATPITNVERNPSRPNAIQKWS